MVALIYQWATTRDCPYFVTEVKITVNVGAILYGCPDLSMGNHKGLPLLKHHPQATQTLTNNKALHKV